MKTYGLEKYIAEHPFFGSLDEKYISLIVGCAKNVVFKENEFLFRIGEDANQFYILRQGAVAVEAAGVGCAPFIIQTLDNQDVLGWSWLFPPYKCQFDARALALTRMVALDGKCLRSKCEADHDLGYELMKRFSELVVDRLQATRIQLMDVYGNPGKHESSC